MNTRAQEFTELPGKTPGYAQRVAEVFTDHLAENGLRMTRQRECILNYLLATDKHLSLEEVYNALRKNGVGRATVFRTLKMLEECGLAERITEANGTSRYEIGLERPHHDHLICVDCGYIQEVRWPDLEKIQARSCRELGFEPKWHRHEVFGRCARCRRKGT